MINRVLAALLLIILSPIYIIITLLIIIDDGRPIFYIQNRPGQNNRIFKFYKFRTMRKETPEVATHLLGNPDLYLLKFGKMIRKLSLDELPNLINVIRGEMVFIGPRPALYNQDDLIDLRTKYCIDKLKPGITGWAQVNGRDELNIPDKVSFEKYYLENKSLFLNLKINVLTVLKVCEMKGVSH